MECGYGAQESIEFGGPGDVQDGPTWLFRKVISAAVISAEMNNWLTINQEIL